MTSERSQSLSSQSQPLRAPPSSPPERPHPTSSCWPLRAIPPTSLLSPLMEMSLPSIRRLISHPPMFISSSFLLRVPDGAGRVHRKGDCPAVFRPRSEVLFSRLPRRTSGAYGGPSRFPLSGPSEWWFRPWPSGLDSSTPDPANPRTSVGRACCLFLSKTNVAVLPPVE
jgi:hypothetical protein